ncbi:MAG: hypothetical protein WCF18_22710 [Chthoniobacteraceae bacterium]
MDIKLRLTLREGSVYYFTDRALTSPLPHYFIVVNSDPLSQRVLVLTVVTSQVADAKLRRAACPETLVEISPADFDVFTKPSIVDGNWLKSIPLAEFNARFVGNEIKSFGKDLPSAIRKALRKAIHASKLVAAEMKALVGPA